MQIQLCLENQKNLLHFLKFPERTQYKKSTQWSEQLNKDRKRERGRKCIHTYCSLGKVYEEMGPAGGVG